MWSSPGADVARDGYLLRAAARNMARPAAQSARPTAAPMDGSRLELTDELLKMMEELQACDARRWPVPFIRFAAALVVAAACVGGSAWPVVLASGGARARVRALTSACVRTSPPLPTRRSRRAKENRRGLATVAHARAWRPRRSRLEEDCIEVGVLSFGSAAVDSAAGRHRDWTVLGVEPGSTGRRCAFTAHRNCYNHSAASVRPMPCKPGQNVCQGYV
jgi:hypothetical protein